MKPSVITNSNAMAGNGAANASASATAGASNGMNIPIQHDYGQNYAPQQQQQPMHRHNHPQPAPGYGSPGGRQQSSPAYQQPQSSQMPPHFQSFGFDPDMDIDMDIFPRTRLSRRHDPFADFGNSLSTDFDFPQFGSMGRRRNPAERDDHDGFFDRLPPAFRQYMPESFVNRRAGSGMPHHGQQQQSPQQQQHPQQHPQQQAHGHAQPQQGQHYQTYVPAGSTPPAAHMMAQSPSKTVCDAAIQTEDPQDGGRAPRAVPGMDSVDATTPAAKLLQHGLRNTMDMGVKSLAEDEAHGLRSQSAPPPNEQQVPLNGKRPTPPPSTPEYGGRPQSATQTSPQPQPTQPGQSQCHKTYYPPQNQPHPQQKQQTPPPQPQTPGSATIRTIPIFVEGRSEPIINAHKEIPNQGTAQPRNVPPPHPKTQQQAPHPQQHYYQDEVPHQQQQHQQQQHPQSHRPAPLNTQQEAPQQAGDPHGGLPPQTPHTLDSINKIQDIQRDVLDLMGKVEQFGGTRQEKAYAYLDEMLTRNLLKLDTIDTNGKESIRLARKEAIKCIQASINVLEAKAEENARRAAGTGPATEPVVAGTSRSASKEMPSDAGQGQLAAAPAEADADVAPHMQQEAIPLPPPPGVAEAAATAREGSPAAKDATSVEASSASIAGDEK